MALPRAAQVWTPGQPQHCQEMCICVNETLNPQCHAEGDVLVLSPSQFRDAFPFLLTPDHTRQSAGHSQGAWPNWRHGFAAFWKET